MRSEPPSKQLAGFIGKFDPAVARLARDARDVLRKRYFSKAVELVYDNYNALAIGWSPNERTSEVIVSLAVYARGVNLYFYYGAALADPQKLLQGAGTRGRFIRLEDVSVLDRPAVAALIRTATQFGDTPLPKTGRGYVVIKSISAKQRSRRPSTVRPDGRALPRRGDPPQTEPRTRRITSLPDR